VSRPDKELKGFEKVYLEAGEQKKVSFALDKRAFAIWDEEIKDWRAQSGPFEILIGASSRDIRLCASIQVESTTQVRRVYSRNTSIGELLAHPVAGKWAGRMKDAFISAHEQSEPGSPEALMLEAFTRELPIRNLAMMHVAEEEDIEQIVAELNGQTGLKVLK
jgi:beta-glucosidase